jgi:hypothetical protein
MPRLILKFVPISGGGERGSLKLGPGSFMGPGEEKKSLL